MERSWARDLALGAPSMVQVVCAVCIGCVDRPDLDGQLRDRILSTNNTLVPELPAVFTQKRLA